MLKCWLDKLFPPKQRSGSEDRPAPAIRLRDLSSYPEANIIFIDASANDIARAVEAWSWLLPEEITIITVSALGDIVFEDRAGSINLLSSLDAKILKIAPDINTFSEFMLVENVRDDWFLTGLMIGARRLELILQPGECYYFLTPPVIGGELSVETMVKLPLVAQMAIAGQIHRQVSQTASGDEVALVQGAC
jgi:hypothetical protein